MERLALTNIEDAASEALKLYKEFKKGRKRKGGKLLEKAINVIHGRWGAYNGYDDPREFKSICMTLINKWKNAAKKIKGKKPGKTVAVQGSLFPQKTAGKTVPSIRHGFSINSYTPPLLNTN